MIELSVYNSDGEETDTFELDADMLGGDVSIPLLHQAVVTYEANQRRGDASTKMRSEVKASTAKPWPQKGTGRARHGARSSPLWIGGGITFGPKPRDFSKKFPKKMKRKALDGALLSKIEDEQIRVVEEFDIPQPKTRQAVELLENLEVEGTTLILTADYDRNKQLATQNLADSELKPITQTNAREVLKYKQVVVEEDALRSYLKERVKDVHDIDVDEGAEEEEEE